MLNGYNLVSINGKVVIEDVVNILCQLILGGKK